MDQQVAPDSQRVERIGEFAVQRVIGEGGMGIVYEATEKLSGRKVALKVLNRILTKSDEARMRFFNEMRIMAGLEHPNIVRSLANLEVDGKLVIVLEYLDGRTLRDELEARGRLPASRAVVIARDVASALVAAHGMAPPVVHRDLKPENLMLLRDGSVKVMDFGVAKVLGDNTGLTRASQAVGTVQYMSPEQAEGGAITQQTDLYALGLLLYEMLSGRPPFDAASMLGVLRQHAEAPPPALPDEVRSQIPAALETLMLALLEKSPRDRPPSASGVLQTLEALGPAASATTTRARLPVELSPARSAGTSPSVREAPLALRPGKKADTIEILDRFEKKKRLPWIAGAVAVIVVGTAIAVPWVLWVQESSRPRPKANRTATAPAAPSQPPPPIAALPPTQVPKDPCAKAALCGPFNPTNPSSLEAEAIIARADQFVRGADATARLMAADFDKVLVNGNVDLTRPGASVDLEYASANGVITLDVTITHFIGRRRTFSSQPAILAPAPCTLKRAFDAARAAGFPFSDTSRALLTQNHADHPEWLFWGASGGFDQFGRADARDCKVEFKAKKVDIKR